MTHPANPRRRVLVAAATADEADSLRTLLSVWGCDVRSSSNGGDALSVAVSFQPNLALLDLRLEAPDGYEVARRLRAMPGLGATTLIALSAGTDPVGDDRATVGDFDHFLTLPIDPEALRRIAQG